jgi:hypothetical protein
MIFEDGLVVRYAELFDRSERFAAYLAERADLREGCWTACARCSGALESATPFSGSRTENDA